jgi:hypothetical protein
MYGKQGFGKVDGNIAGLNFFNTIVFDHRSQISIFKFQTISKLQHPMTQTASKGITRISEFRIHEQALNFHSSASDISAGRMQIGTRI